MKRLVALLLLVGTLIACSPADAAAPIVPADPLPPGAVLRIGRARLRHPKGVTALALSRDGRLLASADEAACVRLWETGGGRLLLELKDAGSSVAISPDGRTLAVGGPTARQP